MNHFIRYPIIILLSVALLIGQFGCVHVPRSKSPTLSEQVKAEPGTIGIAPACFHPETNYVKPAGKGEAAAAGAVAGAGGAAYGIAQNPAIIIIPYAVPIAIGGSAIIGAGVGAILGVSDSKKGKAEAALNFAPVELNIQERLAEHLLSIVQERTHHRFLLLKDIGPVLLDQEVNYGSLSIENINAVLEISVRRLGLWREKGINPPLHFFMTVTARVIRVADNTELYNYTFRYESKEKRKFTKWASNNAQSFKEEIDRGCQNLAKDILDRIISLDSSPTLRHTDTVDSLPEHIEEGQIPTETSEEAQK